MCPAYSGPICSLCCTLEARCHDLLQDRRRGSTEQSRALLAQLLPRLDRYAAQYARRPIISACCSLFTA